MNARQVLRRTRELLSKPDIWRQYNSITSEHRGGVYCLMTAISACKPHVRLCGSRRDLLSHTQNSKIYLCVTWYIGANITGFNDHKSTTLDEVLLVLRKAEKLARWPFWLLRIAKDVLNPKPIFSR